MLSRYFCCSHFAETISNYEVVQPVIVHRDSIKVSGMTIRSSMDNIDYVNAYVVYIIPGSAGCLLIPANLAQSLFNILL